LYDDGVWFVDLAVVSDPYLVGVAVAEALGVRPEPGRPILETLADYVAGRALLLLLDTCDPHVAAVNQVVGRLLGAGSRMRILATSREPLSAPGEIVWRIPPMSLGAGEDGAPDAVKLLLERAAAARDGRPPADSELSHLLRIAQRLDGLPLAIELAAVRLRLFSAAQLADRLDDLFGTLDAGGPNTAEYPVVGVGRHRHSTLRATVDWSYRTLPKTPRRLRQLNVFTARSTWTRSSGWPAQCRRPARRAGRQVTDGRGARCHRGGSHLSHPRSDQGLRRACLVAANEETAARDRHLAWALHALRTSTPTPTGSRSRSRPIRWTALPPRSVRACTGASPLGASARACAWRSSSTTGGASAGSPARVGCGSSGSSSGTAAQPRRSRPRSSRWRTRLRPPCRR
jgi:hypothetical protein